MLGQPLEKIGPGHSTTVRTFFNARVLMIMLLTISNSPLIDDVMVNGTAWPEAATAVMKNAGPRGGTSAVPPLLL